MKVLLTGGMGYIGSHIAVELLARDIDVVIIDNLSNSKKKVKDMIEKISGKSLSFYNVDVCNKEKLSLAFSKEKGIDAVIHLAGFKSVEESILTPLAYYRNNLDAFMALLEVMEENQVNNLIFSSSATVYGQCEDNTFTEEFMTGNCSNPYGWTKYMIEQIIFDYCRANPQFHSIILRYFNPVGAHPSGLIGESPNGSPNNLMPIICGVASGEFKELKIYGFDYPTNDGTAIRDYIHVVDLADAHRVALDYCISHVGVDVFNIGTGKGYSVLDIVNSFEKTNGIKIPYRMAERRSGDVSISCADVNKAKHILGWEAKYGIDDMVRDAWNFQKRRSK